MALLTYETLKKTPTVLITYNVKVLRGKTNFESIKRPISALRKYRVNIRWKRRKIDVAIRCRKIKRRKMKSVSTNAARKKACAFFEKKNP